MVGPGGAGTAFGHQCLVIPSTQVLHGSTDQVKACGTRAGQPFFTLHPVVAEGTRPPGVPGMQHAFNLSMSFVCSICPPARGRIFAVSPRAIEPSSLAAFVLVVGVHQELLDGCDAGAHVLRDCPASCSESVELGVEHLKREWKVLPRWQVQHFVHELDFPGQSRRGFTSQLRRRFSGHEGCVGMLPRPFELQGLFLGRKSVQDQHHPPRSHAPGVLCTCTDLSVVLSYPTCRIHREADVGPPAVPFAAGHQKVATTHPFPAHGSLSFPFPFLVKAAIQPRPSVGF
eukprot:scaffold73_cov337-Pavlova_lutheri.AAC.22